MIIFAKGRKVAILDNDTAVAKNEVALRITHLYTDYPKREIRVVLHKGIINNGIFTITNNDPIIKIITDEGERQEFSLQEQKIITLSERPLFTILTTPRTTDGNRWAGDFRLSDVECMLIDYGFLDDLEIADIVKQ